MSDRWSTTRYIIQPYFRIQQSLVDNYSGTDKLYVPNEMVEVEYSRNIQKKNFLSTLPMITFATWQSKHFGLAVSLIHDAFVHSQQNI